MSDKLMVVSPDDWEFRIQWFIEEDDDMGKTLGEDRPEEIAKIAALSDMDIRLKDEHEKEIDPNYDPTNVEDTIAIRTLATMKPKPEINSSGFYWESKSAATAALKAIKVAIKLYRDNADNWPQWAKTAMVNGWTAPKGWKP